MILFADDEPILRIIAEDYLKDLGYEVLLASNGKEALDLFNEQANKIDIIILDSIMPVMAGEECFKKIRMLDQQIPIIIVSGYSSSSFLDKIKDMDNTWFLQKPYKISELNIIIKEILNI